MQAPPHCGHHQALQGDGAGLQGRVERRPGSDPSATPRAFAAARGNRNDPEGRRVFHNYGHDGMGYILSYGIADEIARLA